MPALNFPGDDESNYPVNDQIYTNNGVSWKFSTANNSWTVITTADPGVDNGDATLGDTMVKLIRVGAQNLLTPAVNFKHDLTTGTLSIKGITTNTLFNLINSAGTTVNSFNKSGVLTGPSIIYRQSSAPSLTADHTGVLWVDTDTSELAVYNGSTWDVIGTGVTLTTAQTISGSKTFSSSVLLSGGSTAIAGSGASKSIVLSPTNSGSTAAAALTLTSTTSTFAAGNVVNFNAIHANVSGVLVDMTGAQTIAGAKTFSDISTFNNQINFNGASNLSTLYADSLSSGNDTGSTLVLRSNLSANSRYIQITRGVSSPADTNSTNGIILNPTNHNGFGRLYVSGNAHIEGTLTVSGTISGTTSSRTVSKGMIAAVTGGGGVVSTAPPALGTLTFAVTENFANRNLSEISVINTSTTSSVAFYYRHEQARANVADKAYAYVERYVVLSPNNGSCILLPGKDVGTTPFSADIQTTGGITTNTLLAFSATGFDLSGAESCPVLVTITLA